MTDKEFAAMAGQLALTNKTASCGDAHGKADKKKKAKKKKSAGPLLDKYMEHKQKAIEKSAGAKGIHKEALADALRWVPFAGGGLHGLARPSRGNSRLESMITQGAFGGTGGLIGAGSGGLAGYALAKQLGTEDERKALIAALVSGVLGAGLGTGIGSETGRMLAQREVMTPEDWATLARQVRKEESKTDKEKTAAMAELSESDLKKLQESGVKTTPATPEESAAHWKARAAQMKAKAPNPDQNVINALEYALGLKRSQQDMVPAGITDEALINAIKSGSAYDTPFGDILFQGPEGKDKFWWHEDGHVHDINDDERRALMIRRAFDQRLKKFHERTKKQAALDTSENPLDFGTPFEGDTSGDRPMDFGTPFGGDTSGGRPGAWSGGRPTAPASAKGEKALPASAPAMRGRAKAPRRRRAPEATPKQEQYIRERDRRTLERQKRYAERHPGRGEALERQVEEAYEAAQPAPAEQPKGVSSIFEETIRKVRQPNQIMSNRLPYQREQAIREWHRNRGGN